MANLKLVLLVLALVCFVVAAVAPVDRLRFVAAGLAAWIASILF